MKGSADTGTKKSPLATEVESLNYSKAIESFISSRWGVWSGKVALHYTHSPLMTTDGRRAAFIANRDTHRARILAALQHGLSFYMIRKYMLDDPMKLEREFHQDLKELTDTKKARGK